MAIPKVGQVFQERYLILEEIGAGGMGLVYRAKQVDVDRVVALKLIRREKLGDKESLARFYREFKLLSRLSHPHIVQFYSLAVDDKSYPFAVSEFLEGKSLRTLLCDEPRLDWQRAMKIAIQISDAMQYIHENEILHRDLKPDNIILQDQPHADFVKLVDFGLAGEFVSTDETQKITWTGQLIGSAAYMSPELTTKKADARSDVYSLGCVLFEMLAGEALFCADTAAGTIYLHNNEGLQARFSCIGNMVPARLFELLSRMLAKEPEKRIQTMKEVSKELRSILKDPETLMLGQTFSDQKVKTQISWIPLVACVLLMGIASFGILKWRAGRDGNGKVISGSEGSRRPPSKRSVDELKRMAIAVCGLNSAQSGRNYTLDAVQQLKDDIVSKLESGKITEKEKPELEALFPGVLVVLARQQGIAGQKAVARATLASAKKHMDNKNVDARVRCDYFVLHAAFSTDPDEIENDLSGAVSLIDNAAVNDSHAFHANIFATNRLIALGRYAKAKDFLDRAIERARKLPYEEDLVIGLAYRITLMQCLDPNASTTKVNDELKQLIAIQKTDQAVLDQAKLVYEMGSLKTVQLILEDSISCLQNEGPDKMKVLPACIYMLRGVNEKLGYCKDAVSNLDSLLSLYEKYGTLTGVPSKTELLKDKAALLTKV